MAPLYFEELPLDIKSLFFSYIDRPTDLKSLCLTSKSFRDLATPLLYRSMHIFVGGPKDMHISSMLCRDNPGLVHIREIFLRLERITVSDKRRRYHSDDSSDDEEVEENTVIPGQNAQFTVRILLDHLPRNTLEIFSWQCWEPLSVDNFLLLCKNQRKLRVIDIGLMDKPLYPELQKNPDIFKNLSELHSVDMYPDTLDRLKCCQKMLQDRPNIEYLCVSNAFDYSDEHPEGLHDSSTRPGLLSRTLFSHMNPPSFENCEPLRLKNLDLDTVELRYCEHTWLRAIDFTILVRLEIRQCPGVNSLFTELSKPHLRPAKLKSLEWLDDETNEHYALEAFEGFLESTNTLEVLHVSVNKMRTLPKVSSIMCHRKTLLSLSIHSQMSHNNVYNYSEEDFGRLCDECKEIRQLSVMFPKTSVDLAIPSPEFTNFLMHAQKLRYLITLNIRRWPTTGDQFFTRRYLPNLRRYEHQLQRFAQHIFESFDEDSMSKGHGLGNRSRLAVVAWGGNGKTRHGPEGNDKFKLKQMPFVRGWKIDPFGQKSMLAVQTIWRLVQFVEPDSDILNHSLYDMHDVHQGP